jgi:EpsI family protein
MTTKRLAILLAVLLGGLSCVFLLPKHLAIQPVGVRMELPEYLGQWRGKDLAVSDKEIYTLGVGTEFARKSYDNGLGDRVQVSIVLSGQDMNTSIHRPERCLPAQGWTVTNNASRPVLIPNYGTLPTTRLSNVRNVKTNDGKALTLHNLNYYYFVGHTDMTGSHNLRTLIDIKDRLLSGYNQRWAYVTISADITKNYLRFGRDEHQTDALIQEVMAKLVPKLHLESVTRGEMPPATPAPYSGSHSSSHSHSSVSVLCRRPELV